MDAHEELLNRWGAESRHSGEVFIRDGIVDLMSWESSPRKVMFLLKEAYDRSGEGFDLCEWIRDDKEDKTSSMWRRAAHWSHLVHSLDSPKSFEEISNVDAAKSLRSSAIVNIKKSNGCSRSSDEDLKKYAREDKEYIKKQIKLINPQIVICGYTRGFVEGFWPDWRKVSDLVYVADGRIFIDYWHPANQYPNKLNYYAFAFLLQQAQRAEPHLFELILHRKLGDIENG